MRPYLSVVAVARNDNYGGDFLHRIQVFVNSLLAARAAFLLDAELIIVEWNPPLDRPPLAEAIAWPHNLEPGNVRVVHVPNNVHSGLPNVGSNPMCEHIGKNVGIRRAAGQFVLCANPDILFSEALIEFLASKRLEDDCIYRVDRCDVDCKVPADKSWRQQLRHCRKHASRLNTLSASVDFPRWLPFSVGYWMARRKAARLRNHQITVHQRRPEDDIHTNGSGDFTLMHKSAWERLRGLTESVGELHVDGTLCCTAVASGLRQVILGPKMCIFHQNHRRAERDNQPAYLKWLADCTQMLKEKKVTIRNDTNWGLANEDLSETTLA